MKLCLMSKHWFVLYILLEIIIFCPYVRKYIYFIEYRYLKIIYQGNLLHICTKFQTNQLFNKIIFLENYIKYHNEGVILKNIHLIF